MKLRIKLITALLSVALALPVFGQTANFEIDTAQGCGSLKVTFKNTSTPAADKIISGYSFTYTIKKFKREGGDTSFVQTDATKDFAINFHTPGVQICEMIMREKNKEATVRGSHTDTVFIRPRPNAFFTVADTFSLSPLTYRFISGKSFTDTIQYRYKWILSDQNKTLEDSIIHLKGGLGIRDLALKEFPLTQDISLHKMRLQVTDWYKCVDNYDTSFLVASKLVLPNVFTPNGDGINDFFKVQTNGRNIYSFKVFTSNGTLIFESDSHSIEWDGIMSSGSKALPGTYYFIIQPTKTEIAIKPEKGFFMLMREKN